MTEAELKEIAERCERATEGPYECTEDWDDWAGGTYSFISLKRGEKELAQIHADTETAEFLRAARTDVPRLLAEIARLRSVDRFVNIPGTITRERYRQMQAKLKRQYNDKTRLQGEVTRLREALARIAARAASGEHPEELGEYITEVTQGALRGSE